MDNDRKEVSMISLDRAALRPESTCLVGIYSIQGYHRSLLFLGFIHRFKIQSVSLCNRSVEA